MRSTMRLISFITLALAWASSARGSNFQVNPVRVHLDDSTKSALLTLANRSAERVRLQITCHRWTETSSGAMQIEPTEDLVAFPTLVSLAPGAVRRIRIGALAEAAGREKTYRVFVEELPSLTPRHGPNAIAIRTRMGIPVFVRGSDARSIPTIDSLRLRGSRVEFAIRNDGNAHFKASTVRLYVERAQGAAIETAIKGWYVLAGGSRKYAIKLPPDAGCVTKLRVRLETEGHDVREKTEILASKRCSP